MQNNSLIIVQKASNRFVCWNVSEKWLTSKTIKSSSVAVSNKRPAILSRYFDINIWTVKNKKFQIVFTHRTDFLVNYNL